MAKYLDLRSDTVTRPSQAMMKAMISAEVGDDVFGDDPTVNMLEAQAAEMLGKQAAVFSPSGTQSNLMAIMAHCQRGDEYIVGQQAHTYRWEGGGAAVLGSVQPQPLDFELDGTLSLKKVKEYIKPLDYHHAKTKLLCIENTQSGKVLPLSYLKDVYYFCKQTGLSSHLDGARIFNASTYLKIEVKEIAQHFDTVSLCLSKGLGAPVGSLLVGSKELMDTARRWRKVLGVGMRQSGILAAAGIYALKNNIERLEEDHAHALLIAQGLKDIEEMTVSGVYTNMVFIQLPEEAIEPLREYLKQRGIIILVGRQTRLVTHLDIDEKDVRFFIQECKNFWHNSKDILKMGKAYEYRNRTQV